MKKTIKIIGISLITIVVIAFIGMFAMGVTPLSFGMHDKIQNNNGIAIDGYDVIAYFKQEQAIKGSDEFTHKWNNLTWKFSSKENLELFLSNSDEYAPCYGGHCAFAIGKGFAAPGNPQFWTINNGKLLLFADESVKADALADIENIVSSADETWK